MSVSKQFSLSLENVRKEIRRNLDWVIEDGDDGIEFLENVRRTVDNWILAAKTDPSTLRRKKSRTRQG